MNLDFSDEQKALKEQVRRFLEDRGGVAKMRAVLNSDGSYDKDL